MVLVQNKYKNTLVGVLRTQITFVTHHFIRHDRSQTLFCSAQSIDHKDRSAR